MIIQVLTQLVNKINAIMKKFLRSNFIASHEDKDR